MVLRLPGEDGEDADAPLGALIASLVDQPQDVGGVEVVRAEVSATGVRLSRALRAWRRGKLQGLVPGPDGAGRVEGRVVEAPGVRIAFDRARWDDPAGCAERHERERDWEAAHRWWLAAADGDGSAEAYARLRAALAWGQLRPRSTRVRDLLGEALLLCPALVEASLRLAGWCLARGDLEGMVAWAAMADAVRGARPRVPLLEGTGSWLVPQRVATWLAPVDPKRAARAAEDALRRSPPPEVALPLLRIEAMGGAADPRRVEFPHPEMAAE